MSDAMTASRVVVINGEARSFAALLEGSAALAQRLERDFGLRPGDRIVVALENGLEHIELLVAAWRLGLQYVAVPPTTSRPTFAGILERISPQAAVVDAGNERLGGALRDWAGSISFLGDASACVAGRGRPLPLHLLRQRPDDCGAEWQQWLPHVPPALFYTSGSTSTAKGVPLHWPRIMDKAKGVLAFYGVTPADRVMAILPLSHVYGVYCLLGALDRGADVVVYRESASPAELAKGLSEHAATVAVCPPIVAAFLFGRHGTRPGIRDRLRVLSMGGAATSTEQARRILAALPRTRVFLSYGLAETYSTICCNEVSVPGSDPGAVGPLRFGAFGEARDPATGLAVAEGDIGELCVGGTVMSGYVGADMDGFTTDGLFRTGDLVRFDRDGTITITGRLKDMINAGGLSINPSEIEEALKQHPAVADCGAFGEPAGDLEVACTAVVLRDVASESDRERVVDDLFRYCRAHLAAKMVPRRILAVDGIPRGALGKIARAELRARCARC